MCADSSEQLQSCIDGVNAGDPAARDLLIAQTQERFLHLARKYLHGPFRSLEGREQTDDVAGEAWLRLHQGWDRFWTTPKDGPVTTVAEFFRRATRVIRDALCELMRNHYGHPGSTPRRAICGLDSGGAADSARPSEPATDTHDPQQIALWAEFHKKVQELPAALRDVVDLLYYHEKSQQEAAELLNLSVPGVKQRWARARMQLVTELEGSPFDWSNFKAIE
jgi:RNA polymerase sigma factor (sigma-70 family)